MSVDKDNRLLGHHDENKTHKNAMELVWGLKVGPMSKCEAFVIAKEKKCKQKCRCHKFGKKTGK